MGAAFSRDGGGGWGREELNFLRFGERTFLDLFALINVPVGKISGARACARGRSNMSYPTTKMSSQGEANDHSKNF